MFLSRLQADTSRPDMIAGGALIAAVANKLSFKADACIGPSRAKIMSFAIVLRNCHVTGPIMARNLTQKSF
jgi:hypothetical protein